MIWRVNNFAGLIPNDFTARASAILGELPTEWDEVVCEPFLVQNSDQFTEYVGQRWVFSKGAQDFAITTIDWDRIKRRDALNCVRKAFGQPLDTREEEDDL